MLSSILNALKPLVWAMCTLAIMLYMFAVVLTGSYCDYLADVHSKGVNVTNMNDPISQDIVKLREKWGCLSRSMLTLYESMAGGISWGEVLDTLHPTPIEN